MGTALSESAFVDKAYMLEHRPCCGVVFRYVRPRSVQAKLLESKTKSGLQSCRSVALMPVFLVTNKNRNLAVS